MYNLEEFAELTSKSVCGSPLRLHLYFSFVVKTKYTKNPKIANLGSFSGLIYLQKTVYQQVKPIKGSRKMDQD